MMKTALKHGFVIILVVILSVAWSAGNATAAIGEFNFDKNTSYDITYYGGGDSLSLIKDVEILRIEVIHDADFLVVQGAGFKVKNYEGYILFSSIRSILPHNLYRIQRSTDYSN